jgi:Predicted hydrolases or acyltransferases (alpha/beta hydrolase superfamily)
VFIHGILESGGLWNQVVSALDSRDVAVVTLDLPGMGELGHLDAPDNLRALADAVTGVVDELSMPVLMIGQSMGAQVAELAALARPDQVFGLVLVTPIPLAGLPVPPETAGVFLSLGGNENAQRQMRAQFSPNLAPDILEEMIRVGMRASPESAKALFTAWSTGDPVGREPGTDRFPVLVIGGENDTFASPGVVASSVISRFPHVTSLFLEETGHWPHIEQPERIAREIDTFLQSLETVTNTGQSAGSPPKQGITRQQYVVK